MVKKVFIDLDEQVSTVSPMANLPSPRFGGGPRREAAANHTRTADKAIKMKARGLKLRRTLAARYVDPELKFPGEW